MYASSLLPKLKAFPLPSSGSQAEPKRFPQRASFLPCSVNIPGSIPHTTPRGERVCRSLMLKIEGPVLQWRVNNRAMDTLEALLVCTSGNRKRTGFSHLSERKEFCISCHDSRAPPKLCVRTQRERSWRLWMVGSRWQTQWLGDPGVKKPQQKSL